MVISAGPGMVSLAVLAWVGTLVVGWEGIILPCVQAGLLVGRLAWGWDSVLAGLFLGWHYCGIIPSVQAGLLILPSVQAGLLPGLQSCCILPGGKAGMLLGG